MKHTPLVRLSLVAVLTAGCTWGGPKLSEYPSAFGPEGATVRVAVSPVAYDGELLETRADGILILSRSRTSESGAKSAGETVIRLLPFGSIASVQFRFGSKLGAKWLPNDAQSREQFRLFSRFPGGLTPELLQQVLKMYGQTEPAGKKP